MVEVVWQALKIDSIYGEVPLLVHVIDVSVLHILKRQQPSLLNDLEFPLLLLVSDWPRRHLLERTSE